MRARWLTILFVAGFLSLVIGFWLGIRPRGAARDTETLLRECRGNIHLVGLGLERYVLEHNGVLPDSLIKLFPRYVSDRSAFHCPFLTEHPGESDFTLIKSAKIHGEAPVITVCDTPSNHQGVAPMEHVEHGAVFSLGRFLGVSANTPEIQRASLRFQQQLTLAKGLPGSGFPRAKPPFGSGFAAINIPNEQTPTELTNRTLSAVPAASPPVTALPPLAKALQLTPVQKEILDIEENRTRKAEQQFGESRRIAELVKQLPNMDESELHSAVMELNGLAEEWAKDIAVTLMGEEYLLNSDPEIRIRTLIAMGELSYKLAPTLERYLLNSQGWMERTAAAAALGQVGSPSSIGPLRIALKDSEGYVVSYAIRSLGQLRAADAAHDLAILHLFGNNPSLAEAAAIALGQIDTEVSSSHLRNAVATGSVPVPARIIACAALAQRVDLQAIPYLIEAMADNLNVAPFARQALNRMTGHNFAMADMWRGWWKTNEKAVIGNPSGPFGPAPDVFGSGYAPSQQEDWQKDKPPFGNWSAPGAERPFPNLPPVAGQGRLPVSGIQ